MYDKNSLNKVMLIGRLGQDPEVNFTNNKTKVANLSVATSTQSKEGEEKTQWTKVTVFAKVAEIVESYTQKGSRLYIEGRLQTDKFEKEGETRYITKVIANNVILLDSGGSKQDQGDKAQSQEQEQSEDDLPF